MTGCRFRDGTYEGQCDSCLEWMPLTDEHWYPRQGMRRCRYCINAAKMVKQTERRHGDPVYREAKNAEQRAMRLATREAFLEYQRRWYRQNRDRITAQKRAEYAVKRQQIGTLDERRAKNREWMRQWRERQRAAA